MNMIMTYKTLILALLLCLASCGTAEFVPTKDICKLEKHWEDNLFQVQINEEPINTHWYLYDDALKVTQMLGDKNLCMR